MPSVLCMSDMGGRGDAVNGLLSISNYDIATSLVLRMKN